MPMTLESVMPLVREGRGEIIVVDSGSTDRTLEIARSYGAKIFSEPWKGFAAQKNSAMDKATCDWVLQLDADEALEPELAEEICRIVEFPTDMDRKQRKGRIQELAYVFSPRTLKEVHQATQRAGTKLAIMAPSIDCPVFGFLARIFFWAAGSSTADSIPIPSCASSAAAQGNSRNTALIPR